MPKNQKQILISVAILIISLLLYQINYNYNSTNQQKSPQQGDTQKQSQQQQQQQKSKYDQSFQTQDNNENEDVSEDEEDDNVLSPEELYKLMKQSYRKKIHVSTTFAKISLLQKPLYDNFVASTSRKRARKQKMDPQFCFKSDAIKLGNHTFLDNLPFVTDQKKSNYVPVLKQYGKLHQQFQNGTNMIFTVSSGFHGYFETNTQIICQFQVYNHIPGLANIIDRDLRIGSLRAYQNNNPNITIHFQEFSYRLHDKQDYQNFINLSKSPYFKLKNNEQQYNFLLSENRFTPKNQYLSEQLLKNIQDPSYFQEDSALQIIKQISHKKLLQIPDLNSPYLIRAHILISSTQPLKVYLHDTINILTCENNLYENCLQIQDLLEISDDYKQLILKQQLESISKILIQSVKDDIWQDPRVFEFIALDLALYEDFSLNLQYIQSIRNLHQYDGYEKIIEHGLEIIQKQFQKRNTYLLDLAQQIEEQLPQQKSPYSYEKDYYEYNNNNFQIELNQNNLFKIIKF